MGRLLLVAVLGVAGPVSSADACGWCGPLVAPGEQVTIRGKLHRASHRVQPPPHDTRDMLLLRWGYELEFEGKRYTLEPMIDKALGGLVGQMVVVRGDLRGNSIRATSITADGTKPYVGKLDRRLLDPLFHTDYPRGVQPSPVVEWRLIGAKETQRVVFGSKSVEAQARKLAGKTVLVRAIQTRSGLLVLSIDAVAIGK